MTPAYTHGFINMVFTVTFLIEATLAAMTHIFILLFLPLPLHHKVSKTNTKETRKMTSMTTSMAPISNVNNKANKIITKLILLQAHGIYTVFMIIGKNI